VKKYNHTDVIKSMAKLNIINEGPTFNTFKNKLIQDIIQTCAAIGLLVKKNPSIESAEDLIDY